MATLLQDVIAGLNPAIRGEASNASLVIAGPDPAIHAEAPYEKLLGLYSGEPST
jgi:hypothetical protein